MKARTSGFASTMAMMLSVCRMEDSMFRVTCLISCHVWLVASRSRARAESVEPRTPRVRSGSRMIETKEKSSLDRMLLSLRAGLRKLS